MKKYIFLLIPAAIIIAVVCCHQRTPALPSVPAATEEQRIAFLRSEGWEAAPIGTQAVTIPQPDGIYADYAALQAQQQLPLTEYIGQPAMLYTYALSGTDLVAELLTADGILIGAQCYDPELHCPQAVSALQQEPSL